MSAQRIIPEVKGWPLVGNLPGFKQNPLQTMIQWWREYGDLLTFHLGPRRLYLISDPEMITEALIGQPDVFIKMYNPDRPRGLELVMGQGLLTSRGELWRRQRGMLQPVFQHRNMAVLYPRMVEAGAQQITRWQAMPQPTAVNVSREMMRLTLEVLTRTMFSTSVMDRVEDIAPALETCMRYAAKNVMNPFMPPLWIPSAENRCFKKALATLDDIIYRMIAQRRSDPSPPEDLLSLLLAATETDSGERMSDRQLRDEMITLFTAGHETTANVLTWTLYLLAANPNWQTRVREESLRLLNGRAPSFEELEQLPMCRAVLQESMRLRPPAGFLMRKIDRDTELNGYRFSHGSLAVMSIYNIHHHPRLWENPEHFEPERFLGSTLPKSQFMPFGLGSRFCIGKHFALTEATALLSMMVQHCEFTHRGPPPEMDMVVTIRPKGGMTLAVVPLVQD